jgi:hypothetical protein
MKKPSIVKLGIVLAAFAAVGVLYAMRGRESAPTAAPEARTIDCICTKCRTLCTISSDAHQEAELISPSNDRGAVDAPRMGATSRPFRILICRNCGEKAVVAVARCPLHEQYFARFELNGRRGRCPDCTPPG